MVIVGGTAAAPRVLLRERLELAVTRVTHQALPERAAVTLRKSPDALAATLATLGAALGAPWGADQKSAALLAWLLL